MVGPSLRTLLWPALLFACAAPAHAGQPPAAPSASRFSAPSATLLLQPAGGGACTVRWDGQTIGQTALLDRAVALVRARIEALGGPQAIDEGNMPLVRLEAPADAPWSCLAPTLGALERAGFAVVALRHAQAADAADTFAHFLQPGSDGDLPPSVVLRFGPGAPVAPGQLGPLLTSLGRAHGAGDAPPNQFVVVPDATSRFGALFTIIEDAARQGVDTTFARCAGAAGTLAEIRCPPPPPGSAVPG